MSTSINLNGIHELDISLPGTTTSSVSSGVVTLTNTSTSTIDLETNGTPNGSQSLLNLVAGSGITIVDDGVGDITFTASSSTITATVNDVTGSRSCNTIYQNTSSNPFGVSGFCLTSGSSTGTVECLVGPTSPPTIPVYGQDPTATVSAGRAGFVILAVPASYYYTVVVTGAVSSTPSAWVETTLS